MPVITTHLINTSATTSIFGQPVLMVIAVIALLSLGLAARGWLAVPILWPYTQFHYAAISVPGLTPYLALCWCFPTPEVWLASIVCSPCTNGSSRLALASGRARRRGEPGGDPYRSPATKIDPSSSE